MKTKSPWYSIAHLALVLIGLSFPVADTWAAATVTGKTLVSEVRTGRTTFDYTYRITVQNGQPALGSASATVTSSSPSTVVLDGDVALGDLAADSSVTSVDTFTIRQNRLVPFDPASLTWVVQGKPLVPNVVGLTQAAATTAITGAGLVLGNVTTQNSGSVPAGSVISQNPLGGASVAPGSAVDLVVSSGPAPVSVPNVVGLTQAAATTAITGAGLVLGNVTTQNSGSVPAGSVISQSPLAGASVAPGSAVDLVVSSGPAPVSVPNVVGLTQAAATTAITGAGLVLGNVTTQYSATVPAGSVISQNPLGGTSVAPGSAVDLVVSSGPAPVSVPNVVGLTQAAATTAITGAGLVLGNVTTQYSASVPAGSVISQSPLAGASVAPGSAVDLVVSSGPAPVSVPNVVGQTQAAATTAITGAGLVLGTVTTQNSGSVPAGSVISQNPRRARVWRRARAVDSGGVARPATGERAERGRPDAGGGDHGDHRRGPGGRHGDDAVQRDGAGGQRDQSEPAAGTSVAAGSAVNLVVSRGGTGERAERGRPDAGGGDHGDHRRGPDGRHGDDAVQRDGAGGQRDQSEPAAGTSVAPGSTVDLVVSAGRPR